MVTESDWHVQLVASNQILMRADPDYIIQYTARATAPTRVRALVQQPATPFTIYNVQQEFMLDTTPATYTFSFRPTVNDYVRFAIVMGNDMATITVDNVSLAEGQDL